MALLAPLAALVAQPAQAETGTNALSVPDRPQNLRSEPAVNSVILSWDDPGDESITKYQLLQRRHGKRWGTWTDIPGSDAGTTTYTVVLPPTKTPRGKADHRGYDFRIRAVNAAGTSRRSKAVADLPLRGPSVVAQPQPRQQLTTSTTTTTTSTTVAPSRPRPPKNVRVETAGDTVVLYWDNPRDSSITEYKMRQRRTGRRWGPWTTISVVDHDISTVKHTVTGYTIRYTPRGEIDRRWHQIELRAVNSAGLGPVAFTFAPPRVN
ncbi:fibronectin type III domain-containing protein [Candidatus Poriferisodalis sp.]|uniref:fibronectin type III domain-containing protein n=1 Tax=Candidatus Poriferisodalis sp. TaxID=3101277 RepID=UPI003B0147AE